VTAALVALLAVAAAMLALATVVQTCYLESFRLRAREYPTLQLFGDEIQERLDPRREVGALAFSLWKHSLLSLLAIPLYGVLGNLLETAAASLAMMLVFGYLIPQLLYRRSSGVWLPPLVPVLRAMQWLMKPVISMLSFMKALAELTQEPETVEENVGGEIQALIEAGAEEGLIEEDDKRLIQTVIEFGDKTVREVMTPRPNIVAIAEDKTLEDLRQLVINEQFSRIPVYRASIDNIVGFVHVRDMFEADTAQRSRRKVREIMREIDAVPESKPVGDLLREMQRDGKHMVVVVSEYGSTAGLATMEDLVEEILGEIRDEHEPALDVTREPDGAFLLSGSYDLDNLHELVEFRPVESTEATTVGGLVTEWMGHVPQPGESVAREGIRIEVLAASDLRVERVRLYRIESEARDE
jgi:CBS domain containing-hemolysin-like protein